jgi:hypothetical protein
MNKLEQIPRNRVVEPGDSQDRQQIDFSMAELIILQGIVLDRIDRDAKEKNAEFFSHTELAKKLEYFITNKEMKR